VSEEQLTASEIEEAVEIVKAAGDEVYIHEDGYVRPAVVKWLGNVGGCLVIVPTQPIARGGEQ
jgi:hypothetical protein